MPHSIPKGLTREHIIKALADLDAGIEHSFGEPTYFQLIHVGKRYATDLGHNFVLSHPSCNNAKSDHLAAEEHLAAWIERNNAHAVEFDARLAEAELPHDFAASVRIGPLTLTK